MSESKSDGPETSVGVRGSAGVQIGDGNTQLNYFINSYGRSTTVGPLVVGDIPQEPAAFQPRADLLAALRSAGPGVSVVRAVTGMRGVGKTQLVAAYARECVADGWRLVAWVNADEVGEVAGTLKTAADFLGIAEPTDRAEESARRLRGWLEADGERCLLVFDDVADPDLIRPYLPAAGQSRVVLTGTRGSLRALGRDVAVDTLSEAEAQAFLAERTGLDDSGGAAELAAELGYLPLALAQAAAIIARERLTYGVYLTRLRSLPVDRYLVRSPSAPYPRGVAEAILLSMDTVTGSDPTGLARDLLDLIAVLSPVGQPRDLLYRAEEAGALTGGTGSTAINHALDTLLDASLLSASERGAVAAHPLVARVARERRARDGTLAAAGTAGCALLEAATHQVDTRRGRSSTLLGWDTVASIVALNDHLAPALPGDDPVTERLLALRAWALRFLLDSGGDLPQAIGIGQPLVFDSARLLGDDHPATLASRSDLAVAYLAAGRVAEAAALLERVLADRSRVLGPDHPGTLKARNDLALTYQAMGDYDEAARLLEQVLADRDRLLGPDHPDTLTARSNLAQAFRATGRSEEATRLLEQVLADRDRLLGPDHPDTLTARSNLALTYQTTERLERAVPLLGQVLAGRLRMLGDLHPDTLAARSNLALAYEQTGRLAEAIALYEQALAGLERAVGADDPRTSAVRSNLAAARRAARAEARVFISFEWAGEREVADRLAVALRSQGLEIADPAREIAPGESIDQRVPSLARSADVILVIIANRGSAPWGTWQAVEAGISGRQAEQVIIPVYTGKVPARLPYALASRKGITLDTQSEESYAAAARQVAKALAARRESGEIRSALPTRQEGYLPAQELVDISELVMAAFRAADRPLRPTGRAQLLEPGPVWIAAERVPGSAELERFGDHLVTGAVGYFVHVGDLPRDAVVRLDKMRLGGKHVVTVSARALRSALADGRAKFFLAELDRLYGSRDNLFDTKNALIDDRFLFGRDAILTTIGSAIGRDEHILISGLRKAGKTSLLNIARQHLADHPVCMVDLQRFDRHGEDWPVALFGLIADAVDRWGRVTREDWPFQRAAPRTVTELASQLEERFDFLGTDPARQRVVVMLDEIERVFPRRGERDATRRWIRAAGALRALAQGERRLVIVIGADLRPTANRENDLDGGETNPFFSFFQEIPMSLLDRGATGDMLTSVARAMGVSAVTEDLVDELFTMTGGHPSLARTIAGEAYRKRRDAGRMDGADLASGMASLDESNGIGFFVRNNLWQPMTPAEKRTAAALARGRRSAEPGNDGRADMAASEARASLKAQGIIEGNAVRVGLLKQWIRDYVDE